MQDLQTVASWINLEGIEDDLTGVSQCLFALADRPEACDQALMLLGAVTRGCAVQLHAGHAMARKG